MTNLKSSEAWRASRIERTSQRKKKPKPQPTAKGRHFAVDVPDFRQ